MTLDQAPARRRGTIRGGSKYSWIAMALLWSLYALNANMRLWAVSSLQPAIVKEYGINSSTMGIISGLMVVAQGLAAIPLAAWVDRGGRGWARKRRYIYILAAYVALSLLSGVGWLTPVFMAFFAIQFAQKIFSGAGEAVEVSMAVEWWPHERVGFAQGLHHTGNPWGLMLMGLVISGMLSIFGPENWRLVFLTIPLLSIPLVIGYWRFSSKENYQKFVDRTVHQGLTPPLGHDVENLGQQAKPGAIGRALKNPNVVVSAAISGLALALYYGMSFLVPLYLVFVGGYSIAATAAFSLVFTITGGLGQVLWGLISDRLGRKFSVMIMCLWMAVGIILMQFIGVSIVVLFSVQLFIGLATNGIYPVLYAMSSESSDPEAIGISNSVNMTGQMLGAIGPVVAGFLVSISGGYQVASGFLAGFYFLGVVMVIAFVLVALFTRETTGWWKRHDRALVPVDACLKGAAR